MIAQADPVLTIRDLHVSVRAGDGMRPIVAGLDLVLERGRIHGLAGESGSGKTMTALAVLGLLPAAMTSSGSVLLSTGTDAVELVGASRRVLGRVRGRRVAMVFQDPSSSLHPQLSVGAQLTDHLRHHLKLSKSEARRRGVELLDRVRVPEPARALRRFPHQFSGGQRQRIAIATALACEPEVLLADEPTTALDVTVQAGVLRLLRTLADETGLSVLLVTHDLGVLSAVADSVTVMRDGVLVETAPRGQLFTSPQHPYTQELLASLPGATLDQPSHAPVGHLRGRLGTATGATS